MGRPQALVLTDNNNFDIRKFTQVKPRPEGALRLGASNLTGREKLENVRVGGLIGRRIYFFFLVSGLTGRQKKIWPCQRPKADAYFP